MNILLNYEKERLLICRDKYGSSPLHLAAVGNKESTLNLLIKAGTDALLVNNAGFKASQVTSSESIKRILLQEEEKQISLERQAKLNGSKFAGKNSTAASSKKVRSYENVKGSNSSITKPNGAKKAVKTSSEKISNANGSSNVSIPNSSGQSGSKKSKKPSGSSRTPSPSKSSNPNSSKGDIAIKTLTGNFAVQQQP